MDTNLKILDLPLKAKWYNLIKSGEKREEYRENKPFWQIRLSTCIRGRIVMLNPRGYTHVRFRYGYTKQTMLFKIREIDFGFGNTSLGAPSDRQVFIIKF